jgi:hypothetical protein
MFGGLEEVQCVCMCATNIRERRRDGKGGQMGTITEDL